MKPFDFAAARHNMVENEVRTNDVTDAGLIDAMRTVPRELFVPADKKALAYSCLSIEVAPGRYMLDPRSFAKMVQAAGVTRSSLVLVIGAATGYATAILSKLADTAVGLEEDEGLVAQAETVLPRAGIDTGVVVSRKLTEGAPEQGPFDVIFVNGMVDFVPKALTDQLKDGGRLVVVVADGPLGRAMLFERNDGIVSSRRLFDTTVPRLPGFEKPKEFAL